MKFEIEVLGENALSEAKFLNNQIKERNLKGTLTELKRSEGKEGSLSISEYLPIIMGATVSGAFVTGIFSLITKWMENNLEREKIQSNEKIESNKTKKMVIRIPNKNGNYDVYEFNNYDEGQISTFTDKLKDE